MGIRELNFQHALQLSSDSKILWRRLWSVVPMGILCQERFIIRRVGAAQNLQWKLWSKPKEIPGFKHRHFIQKDKIIPWGAEAAQLQKKKKKKKNIYIYKEKNQLLQYKIKWQNVYYDILSSPP